ncbi:proline dehydrogenase 1, mitochondrial-like isoform X2 [Petromyzon marinus]|uniref:proline dehydrogenase 1, mitochondrial-like isoform X2 n=1 Tax=Petromyzon marinus TaxID=7757 RepID=UPI003F71D632
MSLLRGSLGRALRRVGLTASRPPRRSAPTSRAPPTTTTGDLPPTTTAGDLPPTTTTTAGLVPLPDFVDTVVAYRSKSSGQLLRALVVYSLCCVDLLVDHNKEILRWAERLLGARLFAGLMKATVYGQFVGGEDRLAIRPTVSAHARHGVGSILDYSVEEDVSHDEAQSQEMSSCSSQAETERTASLRSPRFVAHREFGDRRELVVSARTYIYQDEHRCDQHVDTFLKSIEAAADSSGDGFAAIKLTALGRPQFLMQFSEVLVKWKDFFYSMAEEHGQATSSVLKKQLQLPQLQESLARLGIATRDECGEWFTVMDRDRSGAVDLLEWSRLIDSHTRISKLMVVPNRQTGRVEPLMMTFTDEEERQMKRMLKRMDILATAAVQRGVRLMVDAEQSYFQPAISRLTVEMMRSYNGQRPALFNTYQGYLKGAYDELSVDAECARREGWCLGVKLVRGAYMEQERKRAQQVGYEDPVNGSYTDTTTMYHRCLDLILRDVAAGGRGAIMVASHNVSTVKHTLSRMAELQIAPSGGRVYFGQLLGMCDHITFALGEAGYPVYKYVPYGPVREVLPYLSRRAQENRSVLRGGGGASLERSLVARELRRRLLAPLHGLLGSGQTHGNAQHAQQ